MNYIIFIACISSVLLFVFYVLCIFILHIRIEKLEELQRKTTDLLVDIVEEIKDLQDAKTKTLDVKTEGNLTAESIEAIMKKMRAKL
jgi:hypothetical protein